MMLTPRDLDAGTAGVNYAAGKLSLKLPPGADRKIAAAVIAYVDNVRNPVTVGGDVLENLLRPHLP
jgi:hypothetical protein